MFTAQSAAQSAAQSTAQSTAGRPAAPDRSGAEWGPAKHDPEHPLHRGPIGAAGRAGAAGAPFAGTALRDGDDARPDDN